MLIVVVVFVAMAIPTPARAQSDDLIPYVTGTNFTYKVTIGEFEPLRYRETVWPLANKRTVTSVFRGYFSGVSKNPGKKTFLIMLSVVSNRVLTDGTIVVTMKIVKDELGYYPGVKNILWVINNGSLYECIYVDKSNAPPSDTFVIAGDGISIRLLYMPADSEPTLLFPARDEQYEYKGEEELGTRIEHIVPPAAPEYSDGQVYDLGFTEDLWFVPGTGLVHLEQSVVGETSMIWELVQ